MTTPTRKRKKAAPKTFKAAYDILKTNAAELQQQDEPDIDNLMTTGLSDSLATGCPLHSTNFRTMFIGVMPISLVKLVPIPKLVLI